MTYNPFKEIAPTGDLGEMPMLVIDRKPEDESANWQDHYRLIESVLRHEEEVADCAVDFDGQRVYVALTGDLYDFDDLERIDSDLREMIGRVACFDFDS